MRIRDPLITALGATLFTLAFALFPLVQPRPPLVVGLCLVLVALGLIVFVASIREILRERDG
jgi:hypothetical protein